VNVNDNVNLCCENFLPTGHPTLTMAHEGTPRNFTLRKGGKKQYVGTENANPICKSLSYID
jgi:hypothetical protein